MASPKLVFLGQMSSQAAQLRVFFTPQCYFFPRLLTRYDFRAKGSQEKEWNPGPLSHMGSPYLLDPPLLPKLANSRQLAIVKSIALEMSPLLTNFVPKRFEPNQQYQEFLIGLTTE